jgi:hypothetical protein
MSINISITVFQMFAAIFMSLSYFRTNSKFLKSCDLEFITKFNKIKRSLLKQIAVDKEITNYIKFKLIFKIILSFFISVLCIIFIESDRLLDLIINFDNVHIIFIPILFLAFFIIYLIKLSIKIIEPLLNIVFLKSILLFYNCIYKLSKQSFIAGLGFVFLFLSFILDLINKTEYFNKSTINIFENISIILTLLGVSTVGIVTKKYFKHKSL